MIRPIILAFSFLTRLPVPGGLTCSDKDWGRSVLAYPMVGASIGAFVLLPIVALPEAGAVMAGLVLLLWVLATGGLHLDGLADSADGWAGGTKSTDRSEIARATLEIMKDPRSGPAAVTTLVLVLVLKYAALGAIVAKEEWVAIVAIPIIARTFVMVLLLTTAYARERGLARMMQEAIPVKLSWLLILAILLALPVIFNWLGLVLIVSAIAVFLVLRSMMVTRIGGLTGDTAGAMVEIMEAVLLIELALY